MGEEELSFLFFFGDRVWGSWNREEAGHGGRLGLSQTQGLLINANRLERTLYSRDLIK